MQLVFQFLPLIVFSVVDAFVTDSRISVASAVLFAALQLGFSFRQTRRIDWFVLLDVALVVVLGGISIASDDELFFKLKPALIEGISIVFIVALVFAPERLLLGYFGRMMPGTTLSGEVVQPLKKMMLGVCVLIALHVAAVIYTALHASKETWAFVSGPGFFLLLVPVAAFALVRRRREG